MKSEIFAAVLNVAALAALAVPDVGGVACVPGTDGEVTIAYTLSNEAAVITFDVLSGGDSLGGEALRDVAASSDCWKVIQPGARTIRWRPHFLVSGAVDTLSVKVSAWSVDNPPPVMVVDLVSGTAAADRVRYYPSLDHLPGGLLENAAYRTSKLVFRKVMGVGVNWQMGAPSTMAGIPSTEYAFDAQLSRNYYLGVFEFTQGQFSHFSTSFPDSSFSVNRAMRPLENVAFNEIRCNALGSTSFAGGAGFSDAPYAGSLLDLIRSRTGVAVDLPTDAEWEFACKAGDDGSHWDNGAAINMSNTQDVNMNGRHRYNGGYIDGEVMPSGATADIDNGTAIVGSYAPNVWGFYDMHGNVFEFCLDWYEENISGNGGAVNIDPADSSKMRSGATGTVRVRRGGSWHVDTNAGRPTSRLGCEPAGRSTMWGFRLLVPAGTALAEGPAASNDGVTAVPASAGGYAVSSAGPLEARNRTVMESEAIGIKTSPLVGTLILFR